MIEQVKAILEEVKGIPGLAGRLADSSSLIDDVELDSLSLLTFMLKVEEQLGVEIDFEQLEFSDLHSIEALSAFFQRMKDVGARPDAAHNDIPPVRMASIAGPQTGAWPKVTILCSGVALGVYVPALLVDRQLVRHSIPTDLVVLERYYTDGHGQKLAALKKAYHRNFAMALMGHRMTTDVQWSLDYALIGALLCQWEREERLDFIVWTGFWMPVLDVYRKRMAPKKLAIDVCRIDATVSASFRAYDRLRDDETEVWFWNWEQRSLDHEMPVTTSPPLPFSARADRFVIHGGGWGIGTYQSKIPEFEARDLQLDVIGYEPDDVARQRRGNRYYMVDPAWSPWHPNQEGHHEFPPFGEITGSSRTTFKNRYEYHELYDLIAESKAIISKPGGGTLIDSLASATPIILLEPYGYAEARNAALWQHLGFGLAYEDWRARNFELGILEELHYNLLTHRQAGGDYTTRYVDRLRANCVSRLNREHPKATTDP